MVQVRSHAHKDFAGHGDALQLAGDVTLDKHMRVGIYEQEVAPTYFDMPLEQAIENMYMSRKLPITTTKVRQLLSDYLFTEGRW